jgi:hypothetical protein
MSIPSMRPLPTRLSLWLLVIAATLITYNLTFRLADTRKQLARLRGEIAFMPPPPEAVILHRGEALKSGLAGINLSYECSLPRDEVIQYYSSLFKPRGWSYTPNDIEGGKFVWRRNRDFVALYPLDLEAPQKRAGYKLSIIWK